MAGETMSEISPKEERAYGRRTTSRLVTQLGAQKLEAAQTWLARHLHLKSREPRLPLRQSCLARLAEQAGAGPPAASSP